MSNCNNVCPMRGLSGYNSLLNAYSVFGEFMMADEDIVVLGMVDLTMMNVNHTLNTGVMLGLGYDPEMPVP